MYQDKWRFLITMTVASKTLEPFESSRCFKASFYIPESRLNFPTAKGFRMKISMKLVYQYMAIFFNFSPTSNHFHPQVENCGSNSRRVVVEDDNGKLRLERVEELNTSIFCSKKAESRNHLEFLSTS